MDFNDFIDAQFLFDDIKSKKSELWKCRKESNGTWIEIK